MSIDDVVNVAGLVAIAAFFVGNFAQIITAINESRQREKDRHLEIVRNEQDRKEARRRERVDFLISNYDALVEGTTEVKGFSARARIFNDLGIKELLKKPGISHAGSDRRQYINDEVAQAIFERISELIEKAQRGD